MYLATRLTKFDIHDWHGRVPGTRTKWWDHLVEDITVELMEGKSFTIELREGKSFTIELREGKSFTTELREGKSFTIELKGGYVIYSRTYGWVCHLQKNVSEAYALTD